MLLDSATELKKKKNGFFIIKKLVDTFSNTVVLTY